MLNEHDLQGFRDTLNQCQAFPCVYTFKFICPAEHMQQLVDVFDGRKVLRRPSRSGKYVSVTADLEMRDCEEVIMLYQRASAVPGLVAL